MMDQLTFDKENADRIQTVENSFGATGRPLSKPGRILMGQGRLLKQGRRRPQPKVFFLFNDVMVYGSILLNGHWYKNQKIIPLEDIQIEDMEDGVELKNQWLIRTPCKSFFVSAASYEEKRAWIEHIEECRSTLLQRGGRRASTIFAVSWIPNQAAFRCMRCFNRFTATNRRHHCRKCGFLVCNSCSKQREIIDHIHPTKKLRVCTLCHKDDERSLQRGDSTGKSSSEEEDVGGSSSEEEYGTIQEYPQSSWLDPQMGTWEDTGIYVYPKPMHLRH